MDGFEGLSILPGTPRGQDHRQGRRNPAGQVIGETLMNRTVTALYETRAQANDVRDALVAARLGDHVDIRDQSGSDSGDARGKRDIVEWLGDLFGRHNDGQVFGEGLRRGHFLLSARVDDLNEIRAATILDAATPIDLRKAEAAWRGEGWTSTAPADTSAPRIVWLGVRTYLMEK
jgi:hypothetical protein